MSTHLKHSQWIQKINQNGSMEYFSEDIVKGDSFEERFEFLYDTGCLKKGDLFHVYRKRINNFHKHLCRKHLNNEVAAWKMIATLVQVDYRTIRDFTTNGNTPHKATWEKLKPLFELLEKKERKHEQ